MFKKKIGKCKYHGPRSWCELFVTLALIFIWKKTDSDRKTWMCFQKKTFIEEINLGQIKSELNGGLYFYHYSLPFFWKSLKVLKISSILLHFLTNVFFEMSPWISSILLDFEYEKLVATSNKSQVLIFSCQSKYFWFKIYFAFTKLSK